MHRSLKLTALLGLATMAHAAHAFTLTGVAVSDIDSNHNFTTSFWNTQRAASDTYFDVYVTTASSNSAAQTATILNSGTNNNFSFSLNTPGTYTFRSLYTGDSLQKGMGLYFNGTASNPFIAVRQSNNLSTWVKMEATAKVSGLNNPTSVKASPDSLSYADPTSGLVATITDFSSTQVNYDRIGASGAIGPDGTNDYLVNFTLNVTNPVPEPASMAMLAMGVGTLMLRRRSRK